MTVCQRSPCPCFIHVLHIFPFQKQQQRQTHKVTILLKLVSSSFLLSLLHSGCDVIALPWDWQQVIKGRKCWTNWIKLHLKLCPLIGLWRITLLPGGINHFWVCRTHTRIDIRAHTHTSSPTGRGFILPSPWWLLGDRSNETTTLSAACVSLTVHIFSPASNANHTDAGISSTCRSRLVKHPDLLSKTGCMWECVCRCVQVQKASAHVTQKREQFFTSKSSLKRSANVSACDQKSVWTPSEMCVFRHMAAYASARRGACVRVKVGHLTFLTYSGLLLS